MKILYCISAYTDPQSLDNLIKALNCADNFFVIHIDKKVKDINRFLDIINKYPNVKMCEKRFYIQWGGWNQVLYQELFLEEAKKQKDVDRIVILTGQDYPLWSNSRINDFFETNPDKILMKGIDLSKVSNNSPMFRLLKIYHFGRDWHIRSYKIWRILTGVLRKIMEYLPFKKKRYIIINDRRCDIWQSSGYFSVNREQALFILEKLKNKVLRNYFRTCFVPEEMTIPTIIFNSKYRDNADISDSNEYRGLSTLAAMHLFEYGKQIKVYSDVDFDDIKETDKIFLRKVKSGFSDTLIKRIENELRQ